MQLGHRDAVVIGRADREDQFELRLDVGGCRLLQRPVSIVGFPVGQLHQHVMPLGARPCKAYDGQDQGSAAERCLVERFTRAYQAGDVAAIVALLTEDISLTMPASAGIPGRDLAAAYLATTPFRPGRRSRLIPARANRQPAYGLHIQDPRARICHAAGLIVLTLTRDKISAMTGFDTSVLPAFGLPRTLPS